MLRGSVRIIGGKWRRRQIRFPSHMSIRPTPDRVRETLFNWLAPIIKDTYCLDLFAGSGILGLEALSRGASWVGLVERSYVNAKALHQHLKELNVLHQACVYHQSYHRITMEKLLANMPKQHPIELVFLDPPFRKGMLIDTLSWLYEQSFLSAHAYIYMEYEGDLLDKEQLSTLFSPWKQGKAGNIRYGLWRR